MQHIEVLVLLDADGLYISSTNPDPGDLFEEFERAFGCKPKMPTRVVRMTAVVPTPRVEDVTTAVS